MKDIAAKTDFDGVTVPAPATEVHTADEYNDRRAELQGAMVDSAQTLDVDDPTQLSKALYANGVAAQSMQDNGSAGIIQLTPITGANGLRVATPVVRDYSLLDGAIFTFKVAATNAGNVTVNVGQTVGTYIGAVPLFLEDGTTQIPVGRVVANKYFSIVFDSALDGGGGAFVLLFNGVTGKMLQTINIQDGSVATGTTIIPFDDTIPQNTEGDEYMTLAITPSSATNKLKIEVVVNGGNNANTHHIAALFQDSVANALAVADTYNEGRITSISFSHFMTAGTTSEITFKVRAGGSIAGTFTFNGESGARYGGVLASSITITEILA